MRKFLSCGLIAAFAILPTAFTVCAEPPPAEPVATPTSSTIPTKCTDRCPQPTRQ
ncbi:hypothetical protein [Chamaesiphon sp. VAR_48_metabat_135_sub]|uniref:hypothetical protein n=1 Tax=Chamaesiphon sp. VAR_48_metabat_135_sub TaxID=2964699 RepID=UPI00286BE805|nr:hypothetical protein [Chamaesiphon sp. VAR_48_metabat_135_sub]